MKQVVTQIDGDFYHVMVPNDELEDNYSRGLIVGPPSLDELELPEEIRARLHHELFVRGLITRKDIIKRRSEIFAALQAALAIDSDRVMECYNA